MVPAAPSPCAPAPEPRVTFKIAWEGSGLGQEGGPKQRAGTGTWPQGRGRGLDKRCRQVGRAASHLPSVPIILLAAPVCHLKLPQSRAQIPMQISWGASFPMQRSLSSGCLPLPPTTRQGEHGPSSPGPGQAVVPPLPRKKWSRRVYWCCSLPVPHSCPIHLGFCLCGPGTHSLGAGSPRLLAETPPCYLRDAAVTQSPHGPALGRQPDLSSSLWPCPVARGLAWAYSGA